MQIEKARQEMEEAIDKGDYQTSLIKSQVLDVLINEYVKIKEVPKIRKVIKNVADKSLLDLIDYLLELLNTPKPDHTFSFKCLLLKDRQEESICQVLC